MPTDINPKFLEYPRKVISGDIVAGLYIKQAAQRFLDWLEREDLEFHPEKVERVIRFVSRFKHYKGRNAGERFNLEPWELFIISNIYGFYWKNTDKRVIRNAYIQCARKQGKSMLIAALSLYALFADGESSPEVYICANSAKQAGNLYDMSKTMALQLDPRQRFIATYRDSIKFKGNQGILRTLAFNPESCDGFNASFVVTDEYMEAPNALMYNVMKSSQLQRKNPLNIVICTAGFNLLSPAYKMRETCTEILSGLKTDDTQFAAIYELDEGDRWDNPDMWVKSNPNLGVTVMSDEIADEINRAKNDATSAPMILTKTLNMWLQSMESWLPNDLIKKSSRKVDIESFRGRSVYVGIDLAAVEDITAVSFMTIDDDGMYIFKTFYFLPESALESGVNVFDYKRWRKSGELIVTPGNVTDYDYILNLILANQRDYDLYICAVAYDAWNSSFFVVKATEANLPMVPYSQSLGSFNKPTREFERLIKSGNVILDNNEVTRWMVGNVDLKSDYNDNVKPVKKSGNSKKIDGVITMLEALAMYIQTPQYDNTLTI